MGNLGFSSPRCISSGMAANNIILNCKIGLISEIHDFMIMSEFEDHDTCVRNKTGECSAVFSANLKTELDKCIG